MSTPARQPRGFGRRKPPPGARLDWSHPLARGLFAYWPFREPSGVVHDLVGGQAGTPVGTVSGVPGPWGGPAYACSTAGNGYVDLSPVAASLPTGDRSISCVFRIDAVNAGNRVLWCAPLDDTSTASHDTPNFNLAYTGSGLFFGIDGFPSYSGEVQLASSVSALVGQWHRATVTLTGNTVRGYLDGQLTQTLTRTSATVAVTKCYLGRYNAGFGEYSNVTIDQAAIWARPLSGDEIQALVESPFALFAQPAPRRFFFGVSRVWQPSAWPGWRRPEGLARLEAPALDEALVLEQAAQALALRGARQRGLTPYLPGSGSPPPVPQPSQSGRAVVLVAVTGGNVYAIGAGGTVWTAATNLAPQSPPLDATAVVRSASSQQKLYFADGKHYVYYDPADNTVHPWVAKSGTLPVDGAGNTPRLICTWRGRTVLSGLLQDGQNWFMSAVNDPNNWNYFPFPIVPTQAVAGNNSPLGSVGDIITSLVPYSDDTLIFGGDHTLWVCQGDPMQGGQIQRLSDAIGMAWGIPWARDPYGTLYFVSNQTGIYALQPGQGPPTRISQQIEQLLVDINTGTNLIRCQWDDRWQGLHVYVTGVAAPAAATHFFWEMRSGAWWTDVFANPDHNPLCCVTFDGNTPQDRRALIGSWDGYVRGFSPDSADDDGTAIASTVVLGPLLTKDLDDVLFKDIQALLAQNSARVGYAVFVGPTAEIALAGTPVASGTWGPGRNLNAMVRRSGHAIWVQLTSTSPWALEQVRARLAGQGKVRRRGY